MLEIVEEAATKGRLSCHESVEGGNTVISCGHTKEAAWTKNRKLQDRQSAV
jgi:hypothetical protein